MVGFPAQKLVARKPCAITRFWILLLLLLQNSSGILSASNYLVGLGSYDITGPAADVNMMGYANTEQIASGVHLRLRARAFIVAEPEGNRVVFVNLDACMASQLVTLKVIERLKARYLVSDLNGTTCIFNSQSGVRCILLPRLV